MRVVDRVIVILWALVLFILSFFIWAMVFGWDPSFYLKQATSAAMGAGRWWTSLVGAVLLLFGIYFFALGTRTQRREKAIIKETSLGDVRISLRAVETLVKRAARQIHGIREVETHLHTGPEGLEINLVVTVLPDSRIPEVADQVQNGVSRYIYDTVGVSVSKIEVAVKNVASEGKTRLE